MGGHQKLDRVARRHLRKLAPSDRNFPGIRLILHFEGKNGPDGIKRKSPAKDEPWHYYNPRDDTDDRLLQFITLHYEQLIRELKMKNRERAAFEAAWLAHALADGLTPAHHYPYEEELQALRSGKGIDTRDSIKEKLIMHGDTTLDKLRNNWKMWGGKGLMTTHGTFELGAASLIAPLGFADAMPTRTDIKTFRRLGLIEYFKQQAREIDDMNMYSEYYQKGWTPRLAYHVRHDMGPTMVRTITLVWYAALLASKE